MKLALVWPRMPDRVLASTPLASAWVAKVCLRSWKRRSGRTMVRVPVQVLVSPVTRYPPFSFERPDFSGLAGFPPPFWSAVTPELIQTDHLSPPLPKAHNPVHRPALRDGVISGRGGRFGHTDRTPRLANWAGRVRYPHFHRRTQRITSRCMGERFHREHRPLQTVTPGFAWCGILQLVRLWFHSNRTDIRCGWITSKRGGPVF